jgi:predicted ATPase
MALSTEHGFPHWHAVTTAYGGWALAQLGETDRGLQQLTRGIAAWRAVGCDFALGSFLAALAETQLLTGDAEAALQTSNEALEWVERNSERQFECMVRYGFGDALCVLGRLECAEEAYSTALAVARGQRAKWWELRAAVRLCKLWRDQAKPQSIKDLLAPLRAGFGEGHGLRDLEQADMLLREAN